MAVAAAGMTMDLKSGTGPDSEQMSAPLSSPLPDTTVTDPADLEYWTTHCLQPFASLLASTGTYTAAEQARHVSFFSSTIIPCLGPRLGHENAGARVTPTACPFEPSLNFSDAAAAQSSSGPDVRFTIEPLGRLGGTSDDPFATACARAQLGAFASYASAAPAAPPATAAGEGEGEGGADLRWFEQLAQTLFLSPGEVRAAQARLAAMAQKTGRPAPPRLPQTALAFDLHGGGAAMKAYFFAIGRALLMGRAQEQVVFDTIRGLEPGGKELTPAADMLESWLLGANGDGLPFAGRTELIAIDCLRPEDGGARVKVYSRIRTTRFSAVRQMMTLGGRLGGDDDPVTREGLEVLKGMWHLLLDEPAPIDDEGWEKEWRDKAHHHVGITFGYELRAGNPRPDVKMYLPTWQYARDEAAAVRNWEEIMRLRGWSWGCDGNYGKVISAAFSGREGVPGEGCVHSYASYAYSKRGVYMTSYLAPVIPKDP